MRAMGLAFGQNPTSSAYLRGDIIIAAIVLDVVASSRKQSA
jgi:hypothetical protein